ncbi:hypothetical protein [Aquimarina sp. AU474]|uniref:hypothetical protein n=1 Tax=Aquimarina sp. AU474 TaxID=2108529 RepID=UPI000D690A6D|nr:hypothetical protein [Aquimarina sp. AU474]
MKKLTLSILTTILLTSQANIAQQTDDKDYIEFNDRKNILHGVYLGLDIGYGQIDDGNNIVTVGSKLAYVANRRMELGVAIKAFYSPLKETDRDLNQDFEIFGFYGGLHVENVLFNDKKIKLSIPLLMGLGYIEGSGDVTKGSDMMLVFEPGVNALLNLNKFVQLEGGIKYRYSTAIDSVPSDIANINGFSIGLGAKLGVFNLGKNRYKKELKN